LIAIILHSLQFNADVNVQQRNATCYIPNTLSLFWPKFRGCSLRSRFV